MLFRSKATNFSTLNNTLYPTTQAVSSYITSFGYLTANQTITLSGDVTGSGSTAITTSISNAAVTFSKIQNISTGVLLGRSTAGSGSVEQITIGTGLSLSAGVLSSTATGTGTVTSVSVGNLSPLFTASVATATTTPSITFAQVSQAQNLVFASDRKSTRLNSSHT